VTALAAPWHSAQHLRDIAQARGLGDADLVTVRLVRCARCGASSAVTPALLVGFGHWPDCDPTDDDVRFTRRR